MIKKVRLPQSATDGSSHSFYMVDSCPVDIHSFILTLCDTPDYKGPTSTLRAMYLVMSCIAFDLSIVDLLCPFSFSFPFPFFMHHCNLFRCSFVASSTAQRDSCCDPSWLTRIDPDHQCRDATDLSLVDKLSQRVKTCRSFLNGAGPCKLRSCIHRICHALSFDLSGH